MTLELTAGYRVLMAPRRLLLALVAAVLVLSGARPATAAPLLRRHHRPISGITLTPLGSGTLIRITYAGHLHPFTRVLRSQAPIDAVAVADVDADGDQDILAVREDGDLVLWRHARGRFIFTAAPERRVPARRETAFQRVFATNAPVQSGDERYSAALARAPAAAADRFDTPHVARASSLVLSAFADGSQGRAPPTPIA